MTILGFIRHGVTDWNIEKRAQGQADIPLNSIGKAQAQSLARRIKNEQWDVLYSSDLSRARVTAETISHMLGLPVLLDKRLREKNCGQIEGTTEEERRAKWGDDWSELDLGMEDHQSVITRGISFTEDVILKHPEKRILVVSHGAFIGLTLTHLIPHIDTKEGLQNTSVSKLKYINQQWECELYNCAKHLIDR